MNGSVREVNVIELDETIATSAVPVLVDLWAEWCPPCHALTPVLKELAAQHPETLRIVKVNADDHPEVALRFQVMSLPTLLVFDQGRPVQRMVGARGKQHLLAELAEVMAPAPLAPS